MCEWVCVHVCSGIWLENHRKAKVWVPWHSGEGLVLGAGSSQCGDRGLSWWSHRRWHSGFHTGGGGAPWMTGPCRDCWTSVRGCCLRSGMGLGTVGWHSGGTVPAGPPVRPAGVTTGWQLPPPRSAFPTLGWFLFGLFLTQHCAERGFWKQGPSWTKPGEHLRPGQKGESTSLVERTPHQELSLIQLWSWRRLETVRRSQGTEVRFLGFSVVQKQRILDPRTLGTTWVDE